MVDNVYASPNLEDIAAFLHSLEASERSEIMRRMPATARSQVEQAMGRGGGCDVSDDVALRLYNSLRGRANDAVTSTSDWPVDAAFESLLDQARPELLHGLLEGEHPQIVAVVIACLSPEAAADVLQLFSPELRADILKRLLKIDDADSQAVCDIRQQLAMQLQDRMQMHDRKRERLSRVQAIVSAANPDTRHHLLAVVEQATCVADCGTARGSESQLSVSFDRLADFDGEVLQHLFSSLPCEVTAVAMAGASQLVQDYVLARLSPETTKGIHNYMKRKLPLRVNDIHTAQAIVLRLLERNQAKPETKKNITLSA